MVPARAVRVGAGLDTLQQPMTSIGVDGLVKQDALQMRGEATRRMSSDDTGDDIAGAAREYSRPALMRQVVGESRAENALRATKE